ncbi:MAG: histidinol-phosphate transaminase [Phycisphaerales bacterium]|jgi:histidinol-phosphate aminotransferase|nr:histidinol-phosphate transaminase [Phycisphaerales bacterium]
MAPNFVRSTVRDMDGYVPGEQPAPGERIIKLNTNENPFPPSPKVMQAIREMEPELLRRYPNPLAESFCAAAAKVLDVSPDMILAGNGSDDILTIATRTFIPPGGKLAFPDPTYSLYPVLARLQEADCVSVKWEKDWALPAEGLLQTKANAIYLANPNAPSGTFVSPTKIAQLAKDFDGLILVDEAYVDFADDNCLSLVRQLPNIVISRTFSKAYSLAGLRFGFAVAQPAVIEQMTKVKDSYNCDAIAIIAAAAAIEDQEYARRTWEHVRGERQRLSSELTQMGWTVLPSSANFIFAVAPDGRGREAYLGLKRQGILVRHFDKPGLSDKIRITIGTSQENNALLGGIKALTATEKAA